jgi:hypothetical protein
MCVLLWAGGCTSMPGAETAPQDDARAQDAAAEGLDASTAPPVDSPAAADDAGGPPDADDGVPTADAAMLDAAAGPDAAHAAQPTLAADWCHRWEGEQTASMGVLQPAQVVLGSGGGPLVAGAEVQIAEPITFVGGGIVTLGSFVQAWTPGGEAVWNQPVLERDMVARTVVALPGGGAMIGGTPSAVATSLGDGGHTLAWLDGSGQVTRRESLDVDVLSLGVVPEGRTFGLVSGSLSLSSPPFGVVGDELRSWQGGGAESGSWPLMSERQHLALAVSRDGARLALLGALEQPSGTVAHLELIDAAEVETGRVETLRAGAADRGFIDGHFDTDGALWAVGITHVDGVGEHFVERFGADAEPLWPAPIGLGNRTAVGWPVAAGLGPYDVLILALPDGDIDEGEDPEPDVHLHGISPDGSLLWDPPLLFDSGLDDWPIDLAIGQDGETYLLMRAGPNAFQLCRVPTSA